MRVDTQYKQNKFPPPNRLPFDLTAGVYVQIALYFFLSIYSFFFAPLLH